MQYRIVQAFNDIQRELQVLRDMDQNNIPPLLDYIPPHITDFCPCINLPLETNLRDICAQYPQYSIVFFKCYTRDLLDWNPSFYIVLLKFAILDSSLEHENDSYFLSQVFNVILSGIVDFDLSYVLCNLMKDLFDGRTVLSILQYSETLTGIIVNEFLYADIKGGSYNKRLINLADVTFDEIDILK
jgi:serine/threonine protein kinase